MTETERIDHVNVMMLTSKQGVAAALANDIPTLIRQMNELYTRKGMLKEASMQDGADDGVTVQAADTVIRLFEKTVVDVMKLNCSIHKNRLYLVAWSCMLLGLILGLLLGGVIQS